MGQFVHMELNTSDREGAKAFYEAVFGWSFQDMPMPNGIYTMIAAAKEGVGGIHEGLQGGVSPHWLGYVGVASLKATIDKVAEAGGKLVMEDEVPGMGSFAVFIDPQGAAVAAWEPAAPAGGSAKKKAAKKKAAKKKAAKKKAAKKKAAKKKAAKKDKPKKDKPKKKSKKKGGKNKR